MTTKSRIRGETESSIVFLETLFAGVALHDVRVRFWNGTCWPEAGSGRTELRLNHSGALRRMFEAGTETALAEAYLYDDFDIAGDIDAAFEISDALMTRPGWRRSLALANRMRRLPDAREKSRSPMRLFGKRDALHSLRRDREAIAFHYDVSNEFYRLWLDPRMVYSCAYFESEDTSLEDAQTAKLDLLCRKLRLKPGMEVLEIGCGWGGFALYAARRYGVRVTGVTLSEEQRRFAHERAVGEGLEGRVRIVLRDYRTLPADKLFDAVVSVGMSEHVGAEKLPGYFGTVMKLLKPGGVFLNHAIGNGCRYIPCDGPSFIGEYVFPDAATPPIQSVAAAAASAGFEIRDVENLREHYTLTLRHWVARLEARHEQALAYVTEPAYRVWRLYMAGSAHDFEAGRMAVYQMLLVKTDDKGRSGLPLLRNDWYVRPDVSE